jgi:hypothetical protein
LSACLVVVYKSYRYIFHAVFVVCLLCILGLGVNGVHSPNLEYITIGLFGALIGLNPIQRIETFAGNLYLLILCYCSYLAAITVWNVPFVLLAVGVPVNLWGIYLLGRSDSAPGKTRRHVILLGKYSLFGYVAQIAILQVLSAGLRHVDNRLAVMVVSFVAAFALTMASVEILERFKRTSPIMDRLYRLTFA